MVEQIKQAWLMLRQSFRLFFLIDGVAAYLLGIAVSGYLVTPINSLGFTLGIIMTLLVLMLPGIADAYFASNQIPPQSSINSGKRSIESKWLLLALLAFNLAMITLVIIILERNFKLGNQTGVFAGLLLLLITFLSISGLVVSLLRYKIIIEGIVITFLIPAFSLSFQMDATHPLLMLEVIPLLPIYWACRVALEFETYASDIKALRQSILIVVGWQRGISLHHLFLILGFIAIGLLPIYGVSWSIVWPRLFLLPVIAFQIWQFVRINNGQKPLWKLLRISSNLLFLGYLYLVLLALWIN